MTKQQTFLFIGAALLSLASADAIGESSARTTYVVDSS